MIKSIVDKSGRLLEICVYADESGAVKGYEMPPESVAVSYLNDTLILTNGVYHTPLSPRWVNGAWISEASEMEIQAAYPPQSPQPPSIEQRLAAAEGALLAMMGGI